MTDSWDLFIAGRCHRSNNSQENTRSTINIDGVESSGLSRENEDDDGWSNISKDLNFDVHGNSPETEAWKRLATTLHNQV